MSASRSVYKNSLQLISVFGHLVTDLIDRTGGFLLFTWHAITLAFSRPFRTRLILQQMQFIGNESTFIILLCGFFIGAAVSLQVGTIFVIFGAQSMLGAANAKTLARELSPLMAGFLIAGRGGAAITAEISTMKVNEQIDAMEAMAVDPVGYLVVPRLIACLLMLPLLVAFFNLTGQLASLIIALNIFDIDQGVFFDKMAKIMSWRDIVSGLQKAVIFGGIIALIACRYGLEASGGAKGVGRATTNAVVAMLLSLLCVDFVITYLQIVWK
ncbi:MAG: ABC transporter permease [Proteobacteria bacterium]|nr:ABC transporter permease [Pseudomonadota bacterium]